MLRPQLRIWIPARVEQHEDRPDVMLGRNRQELVDSFLKALRILLPKQIVQKHAHRVHADALSPAQLAVVRRRVKRVGLPHLQLVDGIRRQIVRAHQPRLRVVPGLGLRLAPALLRARGRRHTNQNRGQHGAAQHVHKFLHAITPDSNEKRFYLPRRFFVCRPAFTAPADRPSKSCAPTGTDGSR